MHEIDKGAFDPAQMFSAEGRLIPVKYMPENVRRGIDKITVNEVTRFEPGKNGVPVTVVTRTVEVSLIQPAANPVSPGA